MPRRKKAELYDLVQRIIHMHEIEKKDFKTIASLLRAEGYDISKSAVHRAYRSYAEAAEEFKKIYEETKALIETLKDNPSTDVIEGTIAIVANRIFTFVKDIEAIDFTDPHELVSAIQKLANSAEKLQRYREERLKEIIKEAKKPETTKEEIIKRLEELYGG